MNKNLFFPFTKKKKNAIVDQKSKYKQFKSIYFVRREFYFLSLVVMSELLLNIDHIFYYSFQPLPSTIHNILKLFRSNLSLEILKNYSVTNCCCCSASFLLLRLLLLFSCADRTVTLALNWCRLRWEYTEATFKIIQLVLPWEVLASTTVELPLNSYKSILQKTNRWNLINNVMEWLSKCEKVLKGFMAAVYKVNLQ